MLSSTHNIIVHSVAVITIVIGLGSLAIFGVFLWMGTFGVIDLGMTGLYSLVWNSALCLLFFIQHSGMVRKSFRAWLSRAVRDRCQGVIYTLASGIALVLLVTLWQPLEGPRLQDGALWLSRGVLIACFAGITWGMQSLGRFDAFGTQAYLASTQQPLERPTLVIKGPYRWIRHPFYSFGIIALWASPVWSWDRLIFNFLFTTWIVIGACLEERDLVAKFGDTYRSYQQTVPMLFGIRWTRKQAHASRTA